ncbi:Hypothetical protein A7982_01679 [Minicystis rosea]|nr:Hypothetical protein A7982_01679 [Minicystis rosea]
MVAAAESWVRYVITWGALVILALVSLGLSFLQLGSAFLPISLVIASIMAAIALLFFMHLDAARFSMRIVPGAVLFFVALLVTLTALDVASRRTYPKAPSPNMGEPAGE